LCWGCGLLVWGPGTAPYRPILRISRGATRQRPLIVIADRASFHRSRPVRIFVWQHRRQIRLSYLPTYYLPTYSPERNPDEHVWEEIKDKKLGRQPTKNKSDLKTRLHAALKSLQHRTERVISFFHLPETEYAA
jgi:transposase